MKRTRYHCLLLLLLWVALPLAAQQKLKFSIATFEQDPFDTTPTNKQYEKIDGSGSRYAIVKLTTDIPDDDLAAYRFNFGNLRHEVKVHDGELWVYVQKNAKMVTISREGYATINKHDLGLTIQAGKTYVMRLQVQAPRVQHRILQFRISPADGKALVKVKREGDKGNYELWGTTDETGSIARRLETGIYLYEVSAEFYEPSEGRIILMNADSNYVERVTLRPNFGYLQVDDELGIAGAEIYVDDRKIGTIPYTSKERWDARDDYRIMVTKGELYKTYNSTFSIRKGETTRIAPHLESNFAETTITVDGGAEIFIDGVSRGRGKWTGPLKSGTHDVECRMDRHRPSSRQITVRPDMSETFTLNAPTPIMGSVYVTSTPLEAKVFLDGREMGLTPWELRNVLIGPHTVRVVKDNYRAEEQTVEVQEGETSEARFTLRDFARFRIDAQPQARLRLNGEDKGLTPYTFEGASGNYDIQLDRKKYKTYHSQTTLRSSNPDTTICLKRQYHAPTSGYVQVGIQAPSLMALSVTAGAYIYHVNIEFSYLMGLSSEDVYARYTGDDDILPAHHSLKPVAFGMKVGYGIGIGTRLRLTPQVGATLLSLKDGDLKGYALSGAAGVRADFALLPWLGVYAAPEMDFALKKSATYKTLSDVSSGIKHWGTGFNARVGICLFF